MKYFKIFIPVLFFTAILIYSFPGCGKSESSGIKNETGSVKTTQGTNNPQNTVQNAPSNTTSGNKKPEHIDAKTFKEKIFDYENNKDWKYEGSLPCIVDFYADWCKPCQMVAPILEQLASEYDGKLLIFKVNTDQEQELASAFGIRSIPTLLFVPKTGDPKMTSGALPKEEFVRIINEKLIKN